MDGAEDFDQRLATIDAATERALRGDEPACKVERRRGKQRFTRARQLRRPFSHAAAGRLIKRTSRTGDAGGSAQVKCFYYTGFACHF
jgi:hypothetical protein